MAHATLNSENMRDLFGMLLPTRSCDVSSKLLSFALSGRFAFSCMANYANKNLEFSAFYGKLCLNKIGDDYNFWPFEDINFIIACRKYVSRAQFKVLDSSDEFNAKVCDYLAGMINLEEVNMAYINVPTYWHEKEPASDRYHKLLTANTNISTLAVNRLFLHGVQRMPTAVHFPNLTKLAIHEDILSRLNASKFNRHTYPVLNTLSFPHTRISKEGINKLAKFCRIMHRTISDVEIHISKAHNTYKMERNVEYMNLICNQFKAIKFNNEFTLTTDVYVEHIDDGTVLEEAGFEMEDNTWWSCEKEFDDTTIVYNVLIE
uniref:F-box domain-containing protein n=1 Tax=Panagrellus redivivus TaxID=6233 RepID=A0A7E4UTW8_PANRE